MWLGMDLVQRQWSRCVYEFWYVCKDLFKGTSTASLVFLITNVHLLSRIGAGNPVGLSGFLPPELYVLEALEDLIIISEAVGGSLPVRFGTDAPSVRQLIIRDTEIGGTIPNGYLANSPLESFLVSSNNIRGSVPVDVGQADTLTEIDLSGNKLTGSLPGGLSRYSSIKTLFLDSNILLGSIPANVYTMTSLQRLRLNNNPLMTGSLSSSIGQMESIAELRLGNTGIGGLLPDELFTLPSILVLDIRDATFRGTLPSAFRELANSLQRLHLQDNAFNGTVPTTFGQLTSLNALNLQGNSLVGSIAPEICNLRSDELLELTVDCDEVACSCCTECFR